MEVSTTSSASPLPHFSRITDLNGTDAGAIFEQELKIIRESGVSDQPCVAHIHFTASKNKTITKLI